MVSLWDIPANVLEIREEKLNPDHKTGNFQSSGHHSLIRKFPGGPVAIKHRYRSPFAIMPVESISAVTLFVTDMARSCQFYRALGFTLRYGGDRATFTSFHAGRGYLNLAKHALPQTQWGRAIFYVDDVDTFYRTAMNRGLTPEFEPRDAEWGERYFHIRDPDGHELSFARPLNVPPEIDEI